MLVSMVCLPPLSTRRVLSAVMGRLLLSEVFCPFCEEKAAHSFCLGSIHDFIYPLLRSQDPYSCCWLKKNHDVG